MRRLRGWWPGFVLLMLALPMAGWATSFDGVSFPSTPFMPPKEFLWVPALFLILFTIVNAVLVNRLSSMPGGQSVLVVLIIGALLVLYATFSLRSGYAIQIQDLAWGSPTFWGFRYAIGADFIMMNILAWMIAVGGALCLAYLDPVGDPNKSGTGCVYLLITLIVLLLISTFSIYANPITWLGAPVLLLAGAITAHRRYGRKILTVIALNSLVFVICLMPYLVTGACAHGIPPSGACRHDITWGYGATLLAYVRAHKGRLPEALTVQELVESTQPYSDIGFRELTKDGKPAMCPAGSWLERQPRPYVWNAAVAGKTIDDLRKLKKPVKILSCPYHQSRYIDSVGFITAFDDPDEFYIPAQH
ncbi:MAG: hypothetical protein ACYDCO_14390 [Armatimonadota bacterium]